MFENVKELMFKMDDIKFYSDGTYKITQSKDKSYWKLEDDKFWFKHQANHEWDWDGSDLEFESKFKEKYNLYLLGLIEKELT